jgi:hypothetical protein
MRRFARLTLYVGTAAIVFGFAKVHAAWIGHYDLTGSDRFAWTGVYAVVLCLAAYGAGLPDLPRTRRAVRASAVGAAFAGGIAMSLVQLVVGDAQLPRFVVFASAVVLPDWYRICARLSAGGRLRSEARDRVVVVASADEAATLEDELGRNPERPATVVARLEPADATTIAGAEPLVDAATSTSATVVVLDRVAQQDEAVVSQAAELHATGVRVRTLSLFYDEWIGKVPISELQRVSLLFDIGELHRGRYVRAKRIVDVVLAAAGVAVLALVVPVVALGNLVGNRARCCTARTGSARAGR